MVSVTAHCSVCHSSSVNIALLVMPPPRVLVAGIRPRRYRSPGHPVKSPLRGDARPPAPAVASIATGAGRAPGARHSLFSDRGAGGEPCSSRDARSSPTSPSPWWSSRSACATSSCRGRPARPRRRPSSWRRWPLGVARPRRRAPSPAASPRRTSWCTSAAPCARPASCGCPPAPASRTRSSWPAARRPRRSSPRSIWPRRSTDGQQILVPERGAPAVAAAPASAGSSSAAPWGSRRPGATAPARSSTSTRPRWRSSTRSTVSGRPPRRRSSTTAPQNGGFKTVDEIKEVPGIGDAKFAAMKDSITV